MLLSPVFHNFMLVLSSLHLSHILSNLYVLIEQLKLHEYLFLEKYLFRKYYISTTSIHCGIKVGKWKFSSASYHSSVWFLFHIIKPSRDDVDIVCCINNMLFRQNYHYCWHVEVYIWIKDTQEKQKYIIRMVRKIFQCLSMLLAKKYYYATRLKLYWLHVIW